MAPDSHFCHSFCINFSINSGDNKFDNKFLGALIKNNGSLTPISWPFFYGSISDPTPISTLASTPIIGRYTNKNL